jgi:hypothetical protein
MRMQDPFGRRHTERSRSSSTRPLAGAQPTRRFVIDL